MTKEDLKQLIQEVYEEEMAETKKKSDAKPEPKHKEEPKQAPAKKAEDPQKFFVVDVIITSNILSFIV